MADTTLGLSLDMGDVAKAMAQLPALTGEAAEEAVKKLTASFARAEKAAKALLKAQKAESDAAKKAAEEAEEAAKKAAAAIHDQSRAIKAFGERAGDADTALKAVAGAVGLVSPAAEGALSSLGDLLGGAEGAAKATSLLGGSAVVAAGALTGVAVAVGAAGYAAYAATSAIVELVGGAAELARELQEIEAKAGWHGVLTIDAATLKSFDDAKASLDALGLLGDQLSIALASEFAPAVETSARALLKMGLIGRDLFQEMADGRGILGGLATFAARTLTGALLLPLEVINLWAAGFGKLAALVPGGDALAKSFTDLSDGLSGMRNYIADSGLDFLADHFGPGVQQSMELASRWTASYDDEVDALVGTAGRFAAAERDKADEVDRGIEVTKKATSVEKAAAASSRDAAKAAAKEAKKVAEARADAAAVAQALEKAIGKTTSASEALRLEEAETIAALVEHSATEAQIAEARAAYADRRVRLTEETTARVVEVEQAASDALLDAVSSYTSGRLSEAQRLEADLASVQAGIVAEATKAQADLDKLGASAQAGGDLEALASVEAKKIELAQETQDALTAITEEGERRRADLTVAAAEAQREAVLSAVSSTIGDIGSAFSAYSDLLGDKYQETVDAIKVATEDADAEQIALLEEKQKRQKKGLVALFAAEQAAALAQIAIDTALGFSAVTAAYAANPPLMLGLQALVVTSGIAQAAAVSAARPSINHSGGVIPSYSAQQGETMVRALPGEVMLSRQTVDRMGGPAAADRLNRGGGMGQSPIILEQRYGHRVFDEVVYDDLRRPDSSLRKAVRGTSRVGHRSR